MTGWEIDYYWVRQGNRWRPAFPVGHPTNPHNWQVLGGVSSDVDEIGPKMNTPRFSPPDPVTSDG